MILDCSRVRRGVPLVSWGHCTPFPVCQSSVLLSIPCLSLVFPLSLTPDNVRVGIVSKSVEEKCTQSEVWYGTKYLQEPLPEVTLHDAQPTPVIRLVLCTLYSMLLPQALAAGWWSSPIDPALHLPKPNPFIATDFSLRNPTLNTATEVRPATLCLRIFFVQPLLPSSMSFLL